MPPNMKSTEKLHYKAWGFADREGFANYLRINLPKTVVGYMLFKNKDNQVCMVIFEVFSKTDIYSEHQSICYYCEKIL